MVLEQLLTQDVIRNYVQILSFPLDHPEFIPSLIPIFVGLVVLELYFGKYRYEHLGWNSAVSNSTLLITTSLTLIYELNLSAAATGPQYAVGYSILLLGAFILLLNFYHVWPEELAFNLSSAFLTYTLVYVTIAVVYAGLLPTRSTFLAAGGVLLTFFVVFSAIKQMEQTVVPPRMQPDQETNT